MTKRLVIALYDTVSVLLVASILSCGFVSPAFGYVDPSVMTYTIQAVAGVAVALSAVAGVALRRGRKKLYRLLDIDENAKLTYEPQVHRMVDGVVVVERETKVPEQEIAETEVAAVGSEQEAVNPEGVIADSGQDAGGVEAIALDSSQDVGKPEAIAADSVQDAGKPEAIAAESGQDTRASETIVAEAAQETPEPKTTANQEPSKKRKRGFFDKRPYKPTWKMRLVFGLIVAFFFTFTIFFVAPLEIVGGSVGSLVYTIKDVWWVLVPTGLAIIAGITIVLTLLRGRAFNFALILVFAVGLAAYVQALFLNVGLPAADGATIFWDDYMLEQVVSTAVWVVLIMALLVYGFHNRVRSQGVVALISVFLVIVQGIGLLSLVITPPSAKGGAGVDAMNADINPNAEIVMTEDQLYTVNKDHNVVVFVLDTYDTAYLKRVLDMNPNLLEELTGFTNYENATSAMIPTRFAIPFMMTGQMPGFDEPFSKYKAERYARSSFIEDMYDANYSIGLYTDSLTISMLPQEEQYGITSKTVNMHDLPNSMLDFGGTLYSLYQIGLYRDVPWSLKWGFWYYTDQINSSFVKYDPAAPPEETIYVIDDIRYYNRLCDIGLSVVDDGHDGAFRFIHLLGSHYPFNYDEEVNDLGQDNSDVFKQSQGAIHIVSEYVRQLKELGVYDDTTIIITADHGYWTITEEPIKETSTPIMFIKPAQSAELDAQPIRVDEKPVSHLDLQATVLDAMGLDYSEYTQRDEYEGYSMFGPIDEDRKRLYLTTDSLPDLTETQFREYLIDGNSLEFSNWSETGRTIDAQK